MRVRVPPAAPIALDKQGTLAYVVGAALGDGNLSCPNGRATRLRITCDKKYPKIAEEMMSALRTLLPHNKVSVVRRNDGECFDISVYSNLLNLWMPWEVGKGSKALQDARVPRWIMRRKTLIRACLKGLIQTDGCIYLDRGYRMVNFTNNSRGLAEDAHTMTLALGFTPSFLKARVPTGTKYTVRIAREAQRFIDELGVCKA